MNFVNKTAGDLCKTLVPRLKSMVSSLAFCPAFVIWAAISFRAIVYM
jgi:hypothetical protein